MSYTPFNAPLLSGLLGDMEIASFFSVKADLEAMVQFEVALAHAEANAGIIPNDTAMRIERAGETFEPDVRALAEATIRDGMSVPEFVRQFRATIGNPAGQHVHFGATSQDVIDTSLVLRLKAANEILADRLDTVLACLHDLSQRHGAKRLLARTRMQVALPITVADRLANWAAPLKQRRDQFAPVNATLLQLQFAGPVGTLDTLGDKAGEVRAALAARLELGDPQGPWHTDRSALADYVHWLTQVTTALGKIGTDFALMAQNEIAAVSFAGGGGSSAMAYKQNPVQAESLVTLARFVGALSFGVNAAGIHEQERSGASWTLEWMLLPQLVVATGAALRNTLALLSSIESLGDGPDDPEAS